jgi:hypothetical protein
MFMSHVIFAPIWMTSPLQILQVQLMAFSVNHSPFLRQRQGIIVG